MLRENEWNRDSSPVQLASKSERIRDEGMEGDTAQTETALFCFGRSVTSSHCAALLYKSVCVCVNMCTHFYADVNGASAEIQVFLQLTSSA